MGHRQAFAWIDEWIEMNYEQVREYEAKLQQQTNQIVIQPQNNEQNKTPSPGLTPTESPSTPKSPAKWKYFPWT